MANRTAQTPNKPFLNYQYLVSERSWKSLRKPQWSGVFMDKMSLLTLN